ncbi:hypothetical protein BGW39_009294 [Mortierella sp. 14UC]|nr:hypothetical protein BGW39_009294 [Mortierella sp. 14UC]
MARQHSGYTQLMDDCSSSTHSSTPTSSSASSQPQPRVVLLRNIATAPVITSPTRANVLESLVPLSVDNVMPRIIISPKDTATATAAAGSGATEEKKEQSVKN